jgi:hypothetical protein
MTSETLANTTFDADAKRYPPDCAKKPSEEDERRIRRVKARLRDLDLGVFCFYPSRKRYGL